MRSGLTRLIARVLFWCVTLTALFLLIDRGGDERLFNAQPTVLAGGEQSD